MLFYGELSGCCGHPRQDNVDVANALGSKKGGCYTCHWQGAVAVARGLGGFRVGTGALRAVRVP